ncbi:MAG: hypothetical protein Q9209_002510 [Squamulea sp. 1 TL-2023]
MVWIDHVPGIGFSPGSSGVSPSDLSMTEVAKQFNDFWKHFMEIFGLLGRLVYLTGQGNAGWYIPYIAEDVLDRNDSRYYLIRGIQLMSPRLIHTLRFVMVYNICKHTMMQNSLIYLAPAAMYLKKHSSGIGLDKPFVSYISQHAESCNYNKFIDAALKVPLYAPTGSVAAGTCNLWDEIVDAAVAGSTSCFRPYYIAKQCPYLSFDPVNGDSWGGYQYQYIN